MTASSSGSIFYKILEAEAGGRELKSIQFSMEVQCVNWGGVCAPVADGKFQSYVVELRDFFRERGMEFGSPEDLAGFAQALKEPGTFADELGSLTRSVVYREQGTVAITELLDLMTVAMGGERIAEASEQVREPVRELLAFVGRAMKRNGRAEVGAADAVVTDPAVVYRQQVQTAELSPNELSAVTVDAGSHTAVDVLVSTVENPGQLEAFAPHAVNEFYSGARSITPTTEGLDSIAAALTDQQAERSDRDSGLKQIAALPVGEDEKNIALPRTGPIQWRLAMGVCAATFLLVCATIFILRWVRDDGGTGTTEAATFAVGPVGTTSMSAPSKNALRVFEIG